MSKSIIINNGGWLDNYKGRKKALLKLIYSLASQHGWEIKVGGQKW